MSIEYLSPSQDEYISAGTDYLADFFEMQRRNVEYAQGMSSVIDRLVQLAGTILLASDGSQIDDEMFFRNAGSIAGGYSNISSSIADRYPDLDISTIRKAIDDLNGGIEERNIDIIKSCFVRIPDLLFNGLRVGNEETLRVIAQKVPQNSWYAYLSSLEDLLINELLISDKYLDSFKDEISYMREKRSLMIFPYRYMEKYDPDSITVLPFNQNLKYVEHGGQRLFFPAWTDAFIQRSYNDLRSELDCESPHCYFDDRCDFVEGGIFVDVGAAEGIVSLEVAEKASEIYLLECDDLWVSALEETFNAYADKIHIINKYASEKDNETNITLDTLLKDYSDKDIFIKMDIEGMEIDALRGCVETIKNNNCHIACTCYHTNGQEREIADFLRSLNYNAYSSKGYCLFIAGWLALQNGKYECLEPPYFRRTMIRAVKNC